MVPRKKLPFATLYASIEPEGREKTKDTFSVIPDKHIFVYFLLYKKIRFVTLLLKKYGKANFVY